MDPITLAVTGAAVAGLLGSDRVRKILSNIFSNPKSRSVVLEVNGETVVLDNVNPDEQKRLIEQFIKEHLEKEPTSVPKEPHASEESKEEEAPPTTSEGEKR